MSRRAKSGGIVASDHLVSERSGELSEFEYGLTMATNAFQRWIVRCMTAAGLDGLGALDVMVLHSVNHRGRDKRLADICFVLNVEDSHTVTYSLKKLAKLGLISRTRRGKEIWHATTDQGRAACTAYREVREQCLIAALEIVGVDNEEIGNIAPTLRALSGLYDQAARAASVL